MKVGDLVWLRWLDHSGGWMNWTVNFNNDPLEVESVGWVLAISDDCVTICANKTEEHHNHHMTILLNCLVEYGVIK